MTGRKYVKMNRAARRAYRKRFAAGLCSLALAFSGMAMPQQTWLTGEGVVAYAAESIPLDAKKVDISTLTIESGKCICVINEDGDYHLTGSNLRNGVRVPTQIRVAEGVKANLYLDGVDIDNQDASFGSCGSLQELATFPMDIAGEVTLYTVTDSRIATAGGTGITVRDTAELTMEDGKTLTVSSGENYYIWNRAFDVAGKFTVNGGQLVAGSAGIAGVNISGICTVNGGNVLVDNGLNGYCAIGIDGRLEVNGGELYTVLNDWQGMGIRFLNNMDAKLVVNGGLVSAIGGDGGSGIGAGGAYHYDKDNIGHVEIHGGRVYARAGSDTSVYSIGQGANSVLIDGGIVEAAGAGIGCYNEATSGNCVIKGGFVMLDDAWKGKAYDNKATLTGVSGEGKETGLRKGTIPEVSGWSVEAMSVYTEEEAVRNQKTYGTSDMVIGDAGELSVAFAKDAGEADVVVASGESVKGYRLEVGDSIGSGNCKALTVKSEYEPYKITYRIRENGEVTETITGYTDGDGSAIFPLGAPGWNYAFTMDGETFTGEGITSDVTVDVTRTKHYYQITYSGDYTGTDRAGLGEDVTLPVTDAGVYLFFDEEGNTFSGRNITADKVITVSHRWKYSLEDEEGRELAGGNTDAEGTVKLPEDTEAICYRYYDQNTGLEITTNPVTLERDTVILQVPETRKYEITYKGEYTGTHTMEYGASIKPEGASDGWIYVDRYGAQVKTVNSSCLTVYVYEGTVKDNISYYSIKNAEDFKEFAGLVDKDGKGHLNAALESDIVLTGCAVTEEYCGRFDGGGHTITYHNNYTNGSTSLFQLTSWARFYNLRVDGTIYSNAIEVGGIANKSYGGYFENCSSAVEITFAPSTGVVGAIAGGFVGKDESSSMEFRGCLSEVSVQGPDDIVKQAGFVGEVEWAYIEFNSCFSDAKFQSGTADEGQAFIAADLNNYRVENCYYTNTAGTSGRGTEVSSSEAVSAELAWKLNTNNGKEKNAENYRWAQADKTTHPVLKDASHAAVYRVEYLVEDDYGYNRRYALEYSKKDGTVNLPEPDPEKQGYLFTGWYVDDKKLEEPVVRTMDFQATAQFLETLEHARDELEKGIKTLNENSDKWEEYYTTASYKAAKKVVNDACLAAGEVLNKETATLTELNDARQELTKQMWNAMSKLVWADGTLHLVYGAGTPDVTTEAVRYAQGEEISLMAADMGSNYVFRGWYRGDVVHADSVPVTKELTGCAVIVTEDTTYQAVYATVPEVTAPALTGTYGDTLLELTVSGGSASVPGSWKLDEDTSVKDELVPVQGTKTYTMTFIPEDSFRYVEVSVEVMPQVAPKKITLTIDNASRAAGEENPSFTCKTPQAGVLEGKDTLADLRLRLSSEADKSSPAGTYPITGSWNNANYDITFVNGTLTVQEAAPSPNPSDKPEPSPSTDPSDKPEPSPSTDPSDKPEPSPSTDPSDKPEPSPSTDPSDKPEPSPNPNPSEIPVSTGDVDGNGKVELADAQLALKAALKITTLNETQKKCADVDDNGKVELSDAQKILKVALKIEKF